MSYNSWLSFDILEISIFFFFLGGGSQVEYTAIFDALLLFMINKLSILLDYVVFVEVPSGT